MLTTNWQDGAAAGASGPLLISLTEYKFPTHAHIARDFPGINRAGEKMRRWWPVLDGAVGLQFYLQPLRRRCGSLSVWTDGSALHEFLGRAFHVETMDRYRDRGIVTGARWTVAEFDRQGAYREGFRRIAQRKPAYAASGT